MRGRSLFVPAFLIGTGMMLDPIALVTDPRTLTFGAVLAAAEVGSKWLAAQLPGWLMGVTGPERGLMFSLSVGQAAGALAAVVIGAELGLLGAAEVNAVILVILVSALFAGLSAERNAPNVEPPGLAGRVLGKRVVVPVSNPATVEALVRVAGNVAASDAGAVAAVNVLPFDASPGEGRAGHRCRGPQLRAHRCVRRRWRAAQRRRAGGDLPGDGLGRSGRPPPGAVRDRHRPVRRGQPGACAGVPTG